MLKSMVREFTKEIIFVGNKWDDPGRDFYTEDYIEFGLGYPLKISAIAVTPLSVWNISN